jgi:hypothetical protein
MHAKWVGVIKDKHWLRALRPIVDLGFHVSPLPPYIIVWSSITIFSAKII